MSFNLKKGEILGLVGHSGSGKSTVAWALLGMIRHLGGDCSGEIFFHGTNLVGAGEKVYSKIRWKEIALVSQAAMNSFNPVMKIGQSIREILKFHCPEMNDEEIFSRCQELMELSQLFREVLFYYPHQMSGGMKQRAALALALACHPQLLILDEATTGLDVLTEANLLKVIKNIQSMTKMSIIYISHDLRVVRDFCDRYIVLKDGKMVAKGDCYVQELIKNSYWIKLPKEIGHGSREGCSG